MTLYFSPAQLHSLERELDALYESTKSKIGREDQERLDWVSALDQRFVRIGSELVASKDPRDVLDGVILLALHVQLEFGEMGHPALHGAFDDLDDRPQFHAKNYTWSSAMDCQDWREMHNAGHHVVTNDIHKDHDLGYSMTRIKREQTWKVFHQLQPLYLPILLATGPFMASAYTSGSAAAFRGEHILGRGMRGSVKRGAKRWFSFQKRLWNTSAPLRSALGLGLGSVLGHVHLLSNLFISHHTDDAHAISSSEDPTRGHFYARQILATDNLVELDLPDWITRALQHVPNHGVEDFGLFLGTIDKHIEHHIFPDLPPQRLRDIAPDVRDICLSHGLPYREQPVREAMKHVFQKAFTETHRYTPSPDEALDLDTHVDYSTKRTLTITAIHDDPTASTRTITLALPPIWRHHPWRAGSFINISIPSPSGADIIRQYSLLSPNTNHASLQFAVRLIPNGQGSSYLHTKLNVGDTITALGPPSGSFQLAPSTTTNAASPHSVFIAGGIGITPILSMLRQASQNPNHRVHLLYFNSPERGVPLQHDILSTVQEAANQANIHISFLNSSHTGPLSTDLLLQHAPDIQPSSHLYTCGPGTLMDDARTIGLELGLPSTHIHEERFTLDPSGQNTRPFTPPRGSFTITFSKSKRSITVHSPTTLLDAAHQAGVSVMTGCRSGLCKSCISPCRSGKAVDTNGTPNAHNRVTLCNHYAASDVTLAI